VCTSEICQGGACTHPPGNQNGPCPDEPDCCGAGCCNPDQTCCNNVCGLKGACCFFETGSCSEKTALCCQQEGGAYQGNGTKCTPGDLCRPLCENCHTVNMTFYECRHTTASEPCRLTECTQNTLNSASCDPFPYRKGDAKCKTFDTGMPGEVVQDLFVLPIPTVCETTHPGELREWTTVYYGCGTDCDGTMWRVRCDTGPCGGTLDPAGRVPRGTVKVCNACP